MLSPQDEITECANGREAVQAFVSGQHECVLMDIEMPELDGLSAARQIKACFPQARIIFVTGHEGKILREVASQLGEGFVPKSRLADIHKFLKPESEIQTIPPL